MSNKTTVASQLGAPLHGIPRVALGALALAPAMAITWIAIITHDATELWLELATIAGIVMLPVLVACLRGRIDVLEPIYLVCTSYFLYFVLAPSVDLALGETWFYGINMRPYMVFGLALII